MRDRRSFGRVGWPYQPPAPSRWERLNRWADRQPLFPWVLLALTWAGWTR